MTNNSLLARDQLLKLSETHSKAAEIILQKAKKAPTESEKDALFHQAMNHLSKAMDYREQRLLITLVMAQSEAKKLVSAMTDATKRLKRIERVDDVVYFSGRLLQAAAMLANPPAGGVSVVAEVINLLLDEDLEES